MRDSMMTTGLVHIYCGNGKGKTTTGMGLCTRAAGYGYRVLIYQFMKNNKTSERKILEAVDNITWIDGLDQEKFSFQMTEEEKAEEKSNILNGLNFARKVVVTQECDFLVLDEILGLLDCGIITVEGIADILKHKDESMHIVMTGWNFPEELRPYVDVITTLNTEEVHPLDANE